ncbi:MAG TPA: GNAT family N-acetyltransferase [Gammaproteobacteria bacterium]|nr:GNAT family N-acetyltransferase [Gammaproteobacteria bacterium]
MDIRLDDLSGAEIARFLEEHLAELRSVSPPESTHALDLDELRQPDVTFWTVWDGAELVGCGALKALDAAHVEIKSMRTRPAARGIGSALLRHMLEAARARGFRRVSLETGSMAYFEPARRLYRKHGFSVCAPFAGYRLDPNSVFMTLEL